MMPLRTHTREISRNPGGWDDGAWLHCSVTVILVLTASVFVELLLPFRFVAPVTLVQKWKRQRKENQGALWF